MNILQRYVSGEVLRAFLLSLLTMTAIFVLFMVAAEAMRSRLLTPADVAQLIPYVIPSTLPYTIPVSLLFAVTVVYGRIAGDNEVIAVKSAGLSVMTVIWPTIFLAAILSGFLLHVSRGWIPRSAHRAKLVLFKDLEDTFYKFLKRDREFNNPRWPFLIKVRDVEGKVMIDATFKKRAKGKDNSDTYSATIQAKRAELHFDFKEKLVRVHLDQAELQNYGKEDDVALINKNILEIPHPPGQPVQHGEGGSGIPQRRDRAGIGRGAAADRHRPQAAGDHGRVPVRDRPVRRDQVGRCAEGLRRPQLLPEASQRIRDREAASHLDGLRQPAVRDPGSPGGHPVREARLPERLHLLLRADHHALLPPHALRREPGQGRDDGADHGPLDRQPRAGRPGRPGSIPGS